MFHDPETQYEKLLISPVSIVFSGLGSRNTNSRSQGMFSVFKSTFLLPCPHLFTYHLFCDSFSTHDFFHVSQLQHPVSQLDRGARTDEDLVLCNHYDIYVTISKVIQDASLVKHDIHISLSRYRPQKSRREESRHATR